MAKGSKLGGLANVGAWPGSRGEPRCRSCHRRIIWGDRCPNCRLKLRDRKRRKRRKPR